MKGILIKGLSLPLGDIKLLVSSDGNVTMLLNDGNTRMDSSTNAVNVEEAYYKGNPVWEEE